jgi:hypothetical protein
MLILPPVAGNISGITPMPPIVPDNQSMTPMTSVTTDNTKVSGNSLANTVLPTHLFAFF